MRKNRSKLLPVSLVTLALALGACGTTDSAERDDDAPAAEQASGTLRLKGVCPNTVVVQTDWAPEAEHGALYRLLGPGFTVDASRKRVKGPLVAGGKDTGVQLEVRAGGPAIGFQLVSSQMYQDTSIHLGQVFTDQQVSLSATQPTVAVVAPLDLNPQMIMWDPASHPDWKTIEDIGRTDTKVLYSKAAPYMDYLTGEGILRRSQIDGSYDGAPASFVASGGKIAQQGFATSEPYLYEKVLRQWRKPVKFQLIHDTGYPVYPSALAVRKGKKAELAPCLKRLVPMIQQSQVDYLNDPKATNKVIVDLGAKYRLGFDYSPQQADFSVRQLRKLRIVGNGSDKTLGDFETKRVQRIIDVVSAAATRGGKKVQSGLASGDIATNEFIRASIGLRR
jgi:hypothetical protein